MIDEWGQGGNLVSLEALVGGRKWGKLATFLTTSIGRCSIMVAHALRLDVNRLECLGQLRRNGVERSFSLVCAQAVAAGIVRRELDCTRVRVLLAEGHVAALVGKVNQNGAQLADRRRAAELD